MKAPSTSTSSPSSSSTSTSSSNHARRNPRHRSFRIADSDSEDEGTPTTEPWEYEYNKYMKLKHAVGPKESVVAFWGVSRDLCAAAALTHVPRQSQARTLPTWASLAWDYLAIMASSVPSERAFSSAAETITKRRSRLKADIVEALQVLKHAHKEGNLRRIVPGTLEAEEENASDVEEASAGLTASIAWSDTDM